MDREKQIFKISLTGIIANIVLASVKALIGLLANSIAITMDALNNLTDAISSIITILGVKLAGKDPDKKHPFGYGRTEYLATLVIAMIILYAGVTALVESVKSILAPSEPEYNLIMLGLLVVAVVVKLFLGFLFTNKGKETKSDSLVASGKDALFDSLISVATIIAAVVFLIFGLSIEAYLGVVISLIIMKAGAEILMDTVSKILGEGAEVSFVKEVKKTILAHEGVRGVYDLIFNNYGQDKYVASVHIEVLETMTANEIDTLTRKIMEDVYREHNLLLTAVGLYSYNTTDDEVIAARRKTEEIALSHEHVHQIHGFYIDKASKKLRFDMVISFDAKSRADLYAHVIEDLRKEFPDYEIIAGMDADFNEI